MQATPQHSYSWKIPRLWLWNTLFWIVLWSFSVYNNFQWTLGSGADFTWNVVFSWSFPHYFIMFLTVPIVINLYDRWRQKNYWFQASRHLVPAIISGLLHQFAIALFYVFFHPRALADTTHTTMEKFLMDYKVGAFFSANGFLFYCLNLGLLLGLDLYNRSRQQQLDNLAMSAELNKARFQALQNQLQPHFLFNSFNSLAMMARQEKNKEVVDMISRLSSLLRETLKLGDQYLIPLSREMELIKLYLDIEQIRFRDRLKIEIDMDKAFEQQSIPALLLQPLVENAFHHGISKVEEDAQLLIRIERLDDKLIISITHSALPLPEAWHYEEDMGIGLSNVLNRLDLSYGKNYTFSIGNTDSGKGIITQITLPIG